MARLFWAKWQSSERAQNPHPHAAGRVMIVPAPPAGAPQGGWHGGRQGARAGGRARCRGARAEAGARARHSLCRHRGRRRCSEGARARPPAAGTQPTPTPLQVSGAPGGGWGAWCAPPSRRAGEGAWARARPRGRGREGRGGGLAGRQDPNPAEVQGRQELSAVLLRAGLTERVPRG